jgi:hypothetical protein
MVTGEPGFAKTYLLMQRIEAGVTNTRVSVSTDGRNTESVMLTAVVLRKALNAKGVPAGSVQFFVDGKRIGEPVKLNRAGRANLRAVNIAQGKHVVTAGYTPLEGSGFVPSNSLEYLYAGN